MYNPYQNNFQQQPMYMQPWTQAAQQLPPWQQPAAPIQPAQQAPQLELQPQPMMQQPADLAQAIHRLCDILETMHAKEGVR